MYTLYLIVAALTIAVIGLGFLGYRQKQSLLSKIENLRDDLEHFKKEVPSRRVIPK